MTPLVTISPFDCNEAHATVLLCNDDIGHNIAITQLNISHRAGENNIGYLIKRYVMTALVLSSCHETTIYTVLCYHIVI